VAHLGLAISGAPLRALLSDGHAFHSRRRALAQALGIAEQTHDAMFDAVWKAGQLAVVDPATDRLKAHLPSIDDTARF